MKGLHKLGLCSLVLLSASFDTTAAGFALKEQGAAYLGTAFAGTASAAIDANTSYYNPAGLVELPNSQFVLSATYITANTRLRNATATTNSGAPVINSGTGCDPKGNALIPGMGFSWRYNPRLTFGLTLGAPFGLKIVYQNTDIARYSSTTSEIKTVDISPAFGYKINDCWAIGAGFDAMYIKATLNSAFNVGFGEGFVNNEGTGWTYGYHLGILFTPTSNVNMGLAYHSIFNPKVSGDVETAFFAPPPAPTSLTARVNLPDRITYGVTYMYSDQWTGMGEVEWTHWSRLETLALNYNTGLIATEELYYKNSWRFSFGVDYSCSSRWDFKGGIAFETTPVRDEYRSARLPDSDRWWFTLGTKYVVNKCISLDAAYAFILFKNSTINQSALGLNQMKLNGNYKNSANVVGVQLTWNLV